MPADAVYVGRPTKWGNPYPLSRYGELAVEMFADELLSTIQFPRTMPHDLHFRTIAETYDQLRGKDLVCWCPLGSPCHADVLLALGCSWVGAEMCSACGEVATDG